ncbi:penicillin-binding protein [Enterococcus sp. PF1-24]|uniref:transglycosylase domain-containing protein n=1 Tax=unclassified Enterococcus TaxID=2608891 RepID=UPI002473014E|nr:MULTISPECIES: transglycosylase domain-containing protein [unclassified Enterococcus]MDH6363653.1 penicillin-binding protein [Enterococcus sp. PFB1-1]MDH6400888.1 penicillin-binding protein [Enterococcus sp. PF1-24]
MSASENPNQQKKPQKKIEGDVSFFANVTLRVFQSVFIFIIVAIILLGSLGAGVGAGYFASLVEKTALLDKESYDRAFGNITETSHITYANGERIATISSDLVRTTVASDEISDLLKNAIISTEDEHFYKHKGFVPKAVLRALISEATGIGSSGGSTLTQQLIKQQVLTDETTFQRKANEILLAAHAEKFYSKDEIVTTYLNISPFGRNNKGQNIAGVQEAALGIFGVKASEVNLAQAAFIAGLPQSPIVYSPFTNTGELKEDYSYGLERKDFVLFNMYREKIITKEEYEEAKAYDLSQDFLPQQTVETNNHGFLYYAVLDASVETLAKHNAEADGISKEKFAEETTYQSYRTKARRELENGGYTVTSTIDRSLYDAMEAAVNDYGYMLDDGSGIPVETGSVLMENSTGKILAFLGGRDYGTSENNHALDTMRQSGSTAKPPFVYGPAIDQGMIGSESLISDYSTTYTNGSPVSNAGGTASNTFQTVRKALQVSSNNTAVNTYRDLQKKMGSANFVYDNYLSKMNFPISDNSWQEESAALGSTVITTLDMTNAYQTLANNGVYQEGYMIESIVDNQGNVIYQHEADPVQVYSPAAASIMMDITKSVIDAGITTSYKNILYSLDGNLANTSWAGKTGTSENNVDSWLIVSNPAVTLSNWSGKDNNAVMYGDTGARSGRFMAYLTTRLYQANSGIFAVDRKFELAPDVNSVYVSSFTGLKKGSFQHNGATIQDPGKDILSLWATQDVPTSKYQFGLGGTMANYDSYWSGQGKEADKDKDKDKDADKDKDKDKDNPDSSSSDSSSSSSSSSSSESSTEPPASSTTPETEPPASETEPEIPEPPTPAPESGGE